VSLPCPVHVDPPPNPLTPPSAVWWQVFPEKFFGFIQFEKHSEALAAKRSPLSVLGNRFIKVAWARHDPDDPEDVDADAVRGHNRVFFSRVLVTGSYGHA
jgi:hypothetical protein